MAQSSLIEHWISTGEMDFQRSVGAIKPVQSTILSGLSDDYDGSGVQSDALARNTAESEPDSLNEILTGIQNDTLIPTTEQVLSTFRKSQNLWHNYVIQASQQGSGFITLGVLDPYILLQKVPPLPQHLPKRRIRGEAIWRMACPELPDNHGEWNPEYTHGIQKEFSLSVPAPTKLQLSSESTFSFPKSNNIAILIVMWSYIFSARLIEMQSKKIRYTTTSAIVTKQNVQRQHSDIVLTIRNASKKLIRWLAAILAPGVGWLVTGSSPPWAAHFSEDTRFILMTDKLARSRGAAPSSQEATDLLLEFCVISGIDQPSERSSEERIPQPMAAFLSVLILPLCNDMGLQPRLPTPNTPENQTPESVAPRYIQRYVNDLRYFMTLSLDPGSIGSHIWSIFWEPGIDCNLSSPWCKAIQEILTPTIQDGNLEALAKVFIARRRSPGLLWLGLLLLGDLEILKVLVSYLETLEEWPGYSWARPDVDVAVWTGCKQSFLDEDCIDSYYSTTSQVLRSDLIRHRFNFRLGDPNTLRYGWQPTGFVTKAEVEPELWSRLECKSSRSYERWTWWLPAKDENGVTFAVPHYEDGFTNQHQKIPELTDIKNLSPPASHHQCSVRLSKITTVSVICYGSKDATGDTSLEAMGADIRQHIWLADSRAL